MRLAAPTGSVVSLTSCERLAPHPPGAAPEAPPSPAAAGHKGSDAARGSLLDRAFRAHGAGLLRFLARKVGPDEAGDLLQETFLRAAASRRTEPILQPAAFLRRVAANLLVDRARRHVRVGAVFVPLLDEHDAPVAPQQEEGLAEADLLGLYEAVVDAMPPQMRRVFLMSRVEGLSHREIGERLGISRSAVEQHMMKALRRLMAALKEAE